MYIWIWFSLDGEFDRKEDIMTEDHSCDLSPSKSKKPKRQLKVKKIGAKHSCASCDFAAKTKASCTIFNIYVIYI